MASFNAVPTSLITVEYLKLNNNFPTDYLVDYANRSVQSRRKIFRRWKVYRKWSKQVDKKKVNPITLAVYPQSLSSKGEKKVAIKRSTEVWDKKVARVSITNCGQENKRQSAWENARRLRCGWPICSKSKAIFCVSLDAARADLRSKRNQPTRKERVKVRLSFYKTTFHQTN